MHLFKKNSRETETSNITEKYYMVKNTRVSPTVGSVLCPPLHSAQSCTGFGEQDISKRNTTRGWERACLLERICSPAITMNTCLLYFLVCIQDFHSFKFPAKNWFSSILYLWHVVLLFSWMSAWVNLSGVFLLDPLVILGVCYLIFTYSEFCKVPSVIDFWLYWTVIREDIL